MSSSDPYLGYILEQMTRFKLATYGVEVHRSNQLSYICIYYCCTPSGIRTHSSFTGPDFESGASTSSTTEVYILLKGIDVHRSALRRSILSRFQFRNYPVALSGLCWIHHIRTCSIVLILSTSGHVPY